MARKSKSYTVDFTALERKAGNYKALNPFEKEIVDHMVAKSSPDSSNLSPHQQDSLDLICIAMESLTARQQEVLNLSFGLVDETPLTELQIAERLGITQQGVHDIKARAIKAVQKSIRTNVPPSKTPKTKAT